MFIPIGDTPNPERFRPYINWALIAANVLVYLLISLPLTYTAIDPSDPLLKTYLAEVIKKLPEGVTIDRFLASLSAYDLYVFRHGYKPAASSIVDLFTSMFMHGGFAHLAGNMLFLWIYGDNVEHRLGRVGYLLVYLATGVAATLTYGLFAGNSMTPLVGASGAISGVLGLYFLLFPKNKVKVFVALFPFFFNVVLLPARLVLGFYVVFQNFLPFLLGASSNVAYGAHLGGFFAGILVAFAGERMGWRVRKPSLKPQTQDSNEKPPDLAAAIAAGDSRAALLALQIQGPKAAYALSPGATVQLAQWLIKAGYEISAAEILRRCVALYRGSGGPEIAQAYLLLGLIRLEQGQATSAYQHLLSVFDFSPDPQTEAAARAAISRINVYRN